MKYRPEVDGMRAVAVLLVLLFHAESSWCPGGFIGVDVFFVISGYLITSIIRKEVAAEEFSLLNFYERRARRILPAFVVMLTIVLSVSFFVVLPSAFKGVGRSVTSSALSVSNVLFWAEDDYFAAASEEKPLLHTWSLGVDEQFYILLPLLNRVDWLRSQRRQGARYLWNCVVSVLDLASSILSERGLFSSSCKSLGTVVGEYFDDRANQGRFVTTSKRDVAVRAVCNSVRIVGLLGGDKFPRRKYTASMYRSCRGHSRNFRGSGQSTTVVTASRVYRSDILFALSLALASPRTCSTVEYRSIEYTSDNRVSDGFVCTCSSFVAIRGAAIPIKAAHSFASSSIFSIVDHIDNICNRWFVHSHQ